MAKESTLQSVTGIESYCKDLAGWPRSWMGLPEDLVPGEKMVVYFRPFVEHLIGLGLSRKTMRKHVDNLWVLGGEIIRDLHETPALRKVLVETVVFNVIQDGGPILYHNDSEQQQRSFESTCSKFRRFLQEEKREPRASHITTARLRRRLLSALGNKAEQPAYTLHP